MFVYNVFKNGNWVDSYASVKGIKEGLSHIIPIDTWVYAQREDIWYTYHVPSKSTYCIEKAQVRE